MTTYPSAHRILFGREAPEEGTPVGYAALIDAHDLSVPIPRRLSLVLEHRGDRPSNGSWLLFNARYRPESSLLGHLTFALKYEGLDLAVLKRLFEAVGPEVIEELVRSRPTGQYVRRLWFLYEWLFRTHLDLPDAAGGRYVPVLDPSIQYGAELRPAQRYRLYDNLPGTPDFAPLVFVTETIERYRADSPAQRVDEVVGKHSQSILDRALRTLALADSRSSFCIEGEERATERIERWSHDIARAGERKIDREELLRLQEAVIEESHTIVETGWRTDGGFVGHHDPRTRRPIPDHISARPEDLSDLIDGLLAFDRRSGELDPVVAAASIAFGFVYIHPFADGNGRLHRYLVQHTLARLRFVPPGILLPISSAILDDVDTYRRVLESYSRRLLPVIRWTATDTGNVEALDDTSDFYRFFDATPHTEYLYEILARIVDRDLPKEVSFQQRYDAFISRIKDSLSMPEKSISLLWGFLDQNKGRLSKRARTREFAMLDDAAVAKIEQIYRSLL